MPKTAVSLTLDDANLLWLRGRTAALGRASLSETVDRLISEARAGRFGQPQPARSVVGTVDIAEDDPELERADGAVRDLFERSIQRPLVVREVKTPDPGAPRRKARRRG